MSATLSSIGEKIFKTIHLTHVIENKWVIFYWLGWYNQFGKKKYLSVSGSCGWQRYTMVDVGWQWGIGFCTILYYILTAMYANMRIVSRGISVDVMWISNRCQKMSHKRFGKGGLSITASRSSAKTRFPLRAPCNQIMRGCPLILGTQGSEPEARPAVWFWFWFCPWPCMQLAAITRIIQWPNGERTEKTRDTRG